MIEIEHNIDPARFKWLWAKYVTGPNLRYHCTNCIRGRYSKKFSKHNPLLQPGTAIRFDEQPFRSYEAIYICGVSLSGYQRQQNYLHNVHLAIVPTPGAQDEWVFEQWKVQIKDGRVASIPGSAVEIPERYQSLDPGYTTCRIFRWAAAYFDEAIGQRSGSRTVDEAER
jgi:hypothetical protein